MSIPFCCLSCVPISTPFCCLLCPPISTHFFHQLYHLIPNSFYSLMCPRISIPFCNLICISCHSFTNSNQHISIYASAFICNIYLSPLPGNLIYLYINYLHISTSAFQPQTRDQKHVVIEIYCQRRRSFVAEVIEGTDFSRALTGELLL